MKRSDPIGEEKRRRREEKLLSKMPTITFFTAGPAALCCDAAAATLLHNVTTLQIPNSNINRQRYIDNQPQTETYQAGDQQKLVSNYKSSSTSNVADKCDSVTL